MLKVKVEEFLTNPLFFIEASRILSNLSKLVTVRLENSIFEFDFCRKNGLKVLFFKTRVSRIISSLKFAEAKFFVMTRDERIVKRLQRLENKVVHGDVEFEKGRRKLIMLEGKLFGYPECCYKAYARKKGSFPHETKLILEMFEKGIFEELISNLRNSVILFLPQFFTLNFYPCKADCRRAIRVGLKMEKFLNEFSIAFKLRTMLNALFLLRVAYKSASYPGLLSKKAIDFFEKLEKSEMEMLEAVAEVDYEEFSNKFIRNLMIRIYDRRRSEHNTNWCWREHF
ncbi:MAG: DUF483 domain-containing protein [Archaeoglobaceae archaeon]